MNKFLTIFFLITLPIYAQLDTLFYATFESGNDGFVNAGLELFVRNSSTPIQGARDLHLSNSLGTDQCRVAVPLVLIPGRTYYVSFKARQIGDGGARIFRMASTVGGSAVSGWADTTITNTSNQTYSFTRKPLTATGYLTISMGDYTEIWIDEILITYYSPYVNILSPSGSAIAARNQNTTLLWSSNENYFKVYVGGNVSPMQADTSYVITPTALDSLAIEDLTSIIVEAFDIDQLTVTARDTIQLIYPQLGQMGKLRILDVNPKSISVVDNASSKVKVDIESVGVDSVLVSYATSASPSWKLIKRATIARSSGVDNTTIELEFGNTNATGKLYIKVEADIDTVITGLKLQNLGIHGLFPATSCYWWSGQNYVRDFTCGWVPSNSTFSLGSYTINVTNDGQVSVNYKENSRGFPTSTNEEVITMLQTVYDHLSSYPSSTYFYIITRPEAPSTLLTTTSPLEFDAIVNGRGYKFGYDIAGKKGYVIMTDFKNNISYTVFTYDFNNPALSKFFPTPLYSVIAPIENALVISNTYLSEVSWRTVTGYDEVGNPIVGYQTKVVNIAEPNISVLDVLDSPNDKRKAVDYWGLIYTDTTLNDDPGGGGGDNPAEEIIIKYRTNYGMFRGIIPKAKTAR